MKYSVCANDVTTSLHFRNTRIKDMILIPAKLYTTKPITLFAIKMILRYAYFFCVKLNKFNKLTTYANNFENALETSFACFKYNTEYIAQNATNVAAHATTISGIITHSTII